MALVSTETQLRSMSAGPERFMTMNLMSSGPCTVSKKATSYGRTVRRLKTRDNHTTADVDGARTFVRTSTLTNKPDSYGVADILGTGSMRLHKDTNKPDRQLHHDDIEGSNPRNRWLFRTTRCIDPLEPEYTLPSFTTAPPIAPKFTRDSHDVSDIEGTKSRPLYPLEQRHNHLVEDIEGAQSGWKPRHRRARHEAAPLDHCLNVSDITGGGFRTRRATNPLTPSYRVNGMDVADDPVKSRPRALPKAKDGPFYPLTTADIEGATPGWRPLPQVNPPLEARRHFRNTNFMGDIPGAQADTVKHSICTERHVNPLNPVYDSLDGKPLANPQTPLYKEPVCVEAEAQLDRSIAAEEAATATAAAAATATTPSAATTPAKSQALGRVSSNQEDESRQQQQQQRTHQRQPWKASMRQRPSSEPLASARAGGGRGGDGSLFAYPPPDQPASRTTRALSSAGIWGANPPEGSSSSSSSSSKKETDKRIRRLESEVRLLQRDKEVWQQTRTAVVPGTAIKNNSRGGASSSSGVGGGGTTSRSWPGSSRHRNGREMSSGGTAAAATAATAGGGGAMVLRSRSGDHGSQHAERLVLRSANGTPRVRLTPSERRSAREYTDDVTSVRDLQ
ncbi:unnamed protein product [Ectocarpus sp. 12 AP-2014]